MESNDFYLADSYKNLETIGGIFEKNGKEYINVVLKSGKTHAARVYRPKAQQTTARSRHVIHNTRSVLGFAPKGLINIVRCKDESELKDYCHFHPAFGAYLFGKESLFDLPWEKGLGINVQPLYWYEIVDDKDHLLPNEEIKAILNNKFID